jgi:hypothetical protein
MIDLPPIVWYFVFLVFGGTALSALLGAIGDWLTNRKRPHRRPKVASDELPPAEDR